MGERLTTLHCKKKKKACYEMLHKALELAGTCEHGNEPSGSIKGGESATNNTFVRSAEGDSLQGYRFTGNRPVSLPVSSLALYKSASLYCIGTKNETYQEEYIYIYIGISQLKGPVTSEMVSCRMIMNVSGLHR